MPHLEAPRTHTRNRCQHHHDSEENHSRHRAGGRGSHADFISDRRSRNGHGHRRSGPQAGSAGDSPGEGTEGPTGTGQVTSNPGPDSTLARSKEGGQAVQEGAGPRGALLPWCAGGAPWEVPEWPRSPAGPAEVRRPGQACSPPAGGLRVRSKRTTVQAAPVWNGVSLGSRTNGPKGAGSHDPS